VREKRKNLDINDDDENSEKSEIYD